jgi:hypothetical protein
MFNKFIFGLFMRLFSLFIFFLALTANGLRLDVVADLEVLAFNLALMFIRNPNVQFSTVPAITPNRC